WAFPTTAWNGTDPVAWLEEQAAASVREIEMLPAVRHAYTHFRAVVHPFFCRLGEVAPKQEARAGHAWIGFREFDRYALSALDRKLLKNLLPWENGTGRPPERSGGP
ncbi:MAG TPA: NUDIX domain-containing protein, partial [Syntrophales bacterium]|nr:NUDIX domain-containing protein [Syntrophales bacterium]